MSKLYLKTNEESGVNSSYKIYGDYKKGFRNKNIHKKNEITFNLASHLVKDSTIPFYENQLVTLKFQNGRSKRGFVSFKRYSSTDNDIYISSKLSADKNEIYYASIEPIAHLKFEKYSIAHLEHVKSFLVEISTSDPSLGQKIINHSDKDFIGVTIVNNLNGSTLFIKKENLMLCQFDSVCTTDTRPITNQIRLNHEHRMLLDIELPTFINQFYLDKLMEIESGALVANNSEQSPNFFKAYYCNEETTLSESQIEDVFAFKQTINKEIFSFNSRKKACRKGAQQDVADSDVIYTLSVYPEYNKEYHKDSILFRFRNLFLNTLLRNKQKTKRVIRPYIIDETDNVVRLTANSIRQLGLEENDSIIIRNSYNNKKVSVRALVISDENAIFQENRISSSQFLNLCIGIPAHLRNALDLDMIHCSVTIERDLQRLFKKHLNSQIPSLLGLVLSIVALKDIISSISVLTLISALFFVFLLYLSFSDIRERIDHSNES